MPWLSHLSALCRCNRCHSAAPGTAAAPSPVCCNPCWQGHTCSPCFPSCSQRCLLCRTHTRGSLSLQGIFHCLAVCSSPLEQSLEVVPQSAPPCSISETLHLSPLCLLFSAEGRGCFFSPPDANLCVQHHGCASAQP